MIELKACLDSGPLTEALFSICSQSRIVVTASPDNGNLHIRANPEFLADGTVMDDLIFPPTTPSIISTETHSYSRLSAAKEDDYFIIL